MKTMSLKRFSFLSLMLIITSTIVAAITPKKSEIKRAGNGRLLAQSNDGAGGPAGVASCLTVSSGVINCTATAGTTTTSEEDPSSSQTVNGLNMDTVANTSAGIPNMDSVLEHA